MRKVLLIKHGSLGDIAFSLPAIYSIYKHFYNDKIDILTEKKYFSFLESSRYFKNLFEDNRSSNIFITIKLLIFIVRKKYDLIIDLQNSKRTSCYHFFFRLFSNSKISSSRNFSHFRYLIPTQGVETATNGLLKQIKILNINEITNIKYNWLKINLDERYNKKIVLFIPGVSLKGKYKQWNPEKFAKLANYCENKNYTICVVGTNTDLKSIKPIIENSKKLINNIDNSPPNTIFSIAKKSTLVITNDTGPGHIAALSGACMLWIVNDNNLSKANIQKNSKNFSISSKSVKNISTEQVVNFIEKNTLL